MKHVISAGQFSNREELEKLFEVAANFQNNDTRSDALKGKILASLFFEPSTRTRFSFESAMLRLGGQIISAENALDYSSVKKGETLEDSIRVVTGYADCIVLRHPEKGAAQRAAQVSPVPIINAGDGSGEHPTQALLDVYTIEKELGRVDGLRIALVGDLLHSRTMHSLVQLLGVYPACRIVLVSPNELRIPEEYTTSLKNPIDETSEFTLILPNIDVLYMNRIQKERFENTQVSSSPYVLDAKTIPYLAKDAIILDPLPRVDEISPAVDSDPRAKYFTQAQNGLYVRMALLQSVLGRA